VVGRVPENLNMDDASTVYGLDNRTIPPLR
jgi:hypothetical protein